MQHMRTLWANCLLNIPSDTKLLLTKNDSEINIFGKITNLTRNSLKMSFFPGHFETTKFLKNYEKQFSGSYFRNNFVSEGSHYFRCPVW